MELGLSWWFTEVTSNAKFIKSVKQNVLISGEREASKNMGMDVEACTCPYINYWVCRVYVIIWQSEIMNFKATRDRRWPVSMAAGRS